MRQVCFCSCFVSWKTQFDFSPCFLECSQPEAKRAFSARYFEFKPVFQGYLLYRASPFWYFETSFKALTPVNALPAGLRGVGALQGAHLPLCWKVASGGVQIKQVSVPRLRLYRRKEVPSVPGKKARRQSDRADPALSGCQHATDEYSYCLRACVCLVCVCVCLLICPCLAACR